MVGKRKDNADVMYCVADTSSHLSMPTVTGTLFYVLVCVASGVIMRDFNTYCTSIFPLREVFVFYKK